MPEIFDDIEQGTEQWLAIRAGLPTASSFKAIMSKGEGKTRKSYLHRLAAELVTGAPLESYSNANMERGHRLEAEARELYGFITDAEPKQIGFIRNGRKGCSPDSLIGENGLLEIKTQRGDLLVETLLKDEIPNCHKAQIQGQIWVSEREWCDLLVYWPGMPPFIRRATRDDKYISELSEAIDRFNDELDETVHRIRSYGAMERAA